MDNPVHKVFYANQNDCTPVLNYDGMEIHIVDSDTVEIHFTDYADFHIDIDRENLCRILTYMNTIKCKDL